MRIAGLLAALAFTVIFSHGIAAAQNYGSTYDWQSGNSYRWNTDGLGNTRVYGNNLRTGSMWNTTIQPNGNMRGMDKNFNSWNYNAQTGAYMNSNGHGCIGHGYGRTCW